MNNDSNEYSKDQVDLAFQLLRAHEKMKKMGEEEIDGLKEINDLTKKISHSTNLLAKIKKTSRDLSTKISTSKSELMYAQKTLDRDTKGLNIAKESAKIAEIEYALAEKNYKNGKNGVMLSGDTLENLRLELDRSIQILNIRTEDVRVGQNNVDIGSSIIEQSTRKLQIDESLLKKNKESIKLLDGIISKRKEDLRWAEKLYSVSKYTKNVIEGITSPFLLLGGLLAVGWRRFVELDSAAKDFRTTTKLTKDQTEGLSEQIESMSLEYGKFGIGVKEGYEATAALTAQFGIMNKSVMENKNTVALLTANLGVTNENAAGFVRYMDQVGGMTKEQIANTAGFAKNLSRASKVPLDRIMEDVTHASEQARAMTGGNVVNLIKASVQARKFGVDLNKVAAAARGMLDFNESINSEMEASVLLGKNLSFMDARRYAFAGQLEKAQESTLNQIEKMGDFNSLNVLQQEALAKASGYSVSDLQKMIKMKKDFNSLSSEEKADYTALMKLKESDIKNNNAARDELKKMQMQSTMDTLNNSLATLKNSLAQLLIPILKLLVPVVELFSVIVGKVAELTVGVSGFTQGLIGASVVVGLLSMSFFGISGSISKILSMGGKLSSLLSKGAVGGTKQGGMFEKIGEWFSGKLKKNVNDVGDAANSVKPEAGVGFKNFMKNFASGIAHLGKMDVVRGIGALALLGISIIPFAFAMKLFGNVPWQNVVAGSGALLVLAGSAKILGSIEKDIIKGSLAMVIMGASILPFAFAMKLFGNVPWQNVVAGTGAILGLSVVAKILGSIETDIIKGATAMLILGLATIPLGIALSMFSDLNWQGVLVGLGALGALALGAAALGAFFPIIAAGAGAIALLGLSLVPFAFSAQIAGDAMLSMSNGLASIIPQLSKLASISGELMLATGAIYALSAAFAAFGASQTVSGLGSFVGNLLGGDRIKELQKLAELGPQLQVTANAIKTISDPSRDSGSGASGTSSNEAIVKKLDELIGLMKSGGIAVNLDGKKVSSGLASAVS